ncbi:hypothetical protein SAMN05192549_105188 [Duganella sacchari]|uniref:Flagellar FliJ protein n=2 Tax=Duganella sacchari TaxID=551987 RepID=A0A1M7PLB1_9BURK|nr:hypothetical protein SAMN05192549_105188 [Duganella sacchari]
MSGADLRGFRYALAPLLERQRWQLEAQQRQLAVQQQAIARDAAHQRALEQRYRAFGEASGRELTAGFDLARHQRHLAYLAQLRGEILGVAAELEFKREQEREQRVLCQQLQCKLDLLEQHREQAAADYGQQQASRIASEMDREWMARRVWHAQTEPQA